MAGEDKVNLFAELIFSFLSLFKKEPKKPTKVVVDEAKLKEEKEKLDKEIEDFLRRSRD